VGAFVLQQAAPLQGPEQGVHQKVTVLRPRKQGLRRPSWQRQTLQDVRPPGVGVHTNHAVLCRTHLSQPKVQAVRKVHYKTPATVAGCGTYKQVQNCMIAVEPTAINKELQT
jgi:hypothetical protein